MKARHLLPLLTAAALVATAFAQEHAPDRVEIFGGYSHTSYGVFDRYSGPWVSTPFNGFEVSGTVNLASHVGAEVNVGYGLNPANYRIRTVMGGPHISAEFNRVGFYAHALFGALYFTPNPSSAGSDSFAFALGGGADLWFTHHYGARLIQFDYIHNNNQAAVLGYQPGGTTGPGNAFRVATGILFRF